jgi:hypothetical protein
MNIVEQLLVPILNYIEKRKYRHESPSLLAHNMVWFTNCSWLEQTTSFKQLSGYYSK